MTFEILASFFIGAAIAALTTWLFMKNAVLKKDADLNLLTERLKTQDQLQNQFELVAAKILEDKATKVSEQNLKNLGIILEPFKEKLKDFEKKVEDVYSTERSERGSLRGELSKLVELNVKMSNETENLTKALKGDVKTQGNWGEMILESILERSGLRKGEEYIIQGQELGLKNDEGQTIKPDVIINLPENKHVIVDSKVSLQAYELYSQSENKEEQERYGRLHVESLKKHIDGLSAKKYQSSDKLITPDFVILFMPIEPAFALAFKLKPDLLQYAWDKNIALVSPTTLLTTLRTVAAIWKQELRQKNAEEIAKRGGLLYDKFVGLIDDLSEVGEKIESAQKAHATMMNKLSQGQGNLISQVEKLKDLGAKTSKKLIEFESKL
jgi:DNA recombination protein RmuC